MKSYKLFIIILAMTLMSLASSACPSSTLQRQSMCDLRNGFVVAGVSTAPASWACTNRVPASEPCTWAGVVCDSACNFITFNLGNAGIGGTLSSSIGNLATLQNIFLYGNSIGGSMPVEIGYLQNLQMLEIDHNKFTGGFPEICNYYSKADFINALSSHYYGPANPTFLGLVNLTLFQADYNQFSCMPAFFFYGRLQTVVKGLWSMATTDSLYYDPTVPQCATLKPTPAPTYTPKPTFTAQPSYTKAPTTSRPTALPTTSAQFKWRSNMNYYDGNINTNTTYLYNVFFGNWSASQIASNPTTMGILNDFVTNLGSSAWYKNLGTYWDNTGYRPSNAIFNGSFLVNSTNYAKSINSGDIENLVFMPNMISGKIFFHWGHENSLYNFFPSDDVFVDKYEYPYGTADCTSICGFHTFMPWTYKGFNNRVKYTVQANSQTRANVIAKCGCSWYGTDQVSPNGNWVADSFIYILSHEIAEAVSDSTQGWNTCPYCTGENGDNCIWRQGDDYNGDFLYLPAVNRFGNTVLTNIKLGTRNYHIQPTWVNYGFGCCSVGWPLDRSHGEQYVCDKVTAPPAVLYADGVPPI